MEPLAFMAARAIEGAHGGPATLTELSPSILVTTTRDGRDVLLLPVGVGASLRRRT